jgi:hypothetical protein
MSISMPSNIQRWDDVRADFRDSNQMFGIAQQGISNAGTVFGQLRASILAEEQKAIDNAYKEKAFNENVRQFGLTSALEKDKFGETKRSNIVKEKDSDLDRTQQFDIANMQNRAAMAGVTAQNRSTALREKEYNDQQNLLSIQTKVHQDILGEAQALEKEKANLTAGINSGTLTGDSLTTSKARLAQIDGIIRTDYTASALDKRIANEIAIRGGGIVPATSMSNEATAEQARANAAITRSTEAAKSFDQSQVKANEIQSKLNLGTDDTIALQKAMSKVQQQYPNLKPETAMSILSSFYPTTMKKTPGGLFGGTQKFDVPILEPDHLADFNPTDSKNPIALRLAQAAGKGENLLSGSGDTTKTPNPTPKEDQPISLGNLTDEALTYQREKILASQPSEPSSEQIQTRFNQLVRSSWGDMPMDKIPTNSLRTLEEIALQDTKTAIQKERAQATRKVDDEINNRKLHTNNITNMYNSMMYSR